MLVRSWLVLCVLLFVASGASPQDEAASERPAPTPAQDGQPTDALGDETEEPLSPELEQIVEEAGEAEATQILSEKAQVTERVRAILRAVDDFHGIRAEVEAGIVVLSGAAQSREAAERAVATVEKLDGVLFVVDDVSIERALPVRLRDSWSTVTDRWRELVAALPLFGVAVAIVLAFWLLARFLRDAAFPYRFARDRALLQTLLRQTVHGALIIAGVVVALRFLDAGTVIGTILGAAGVVGIALGFAFRNIVENYLAGVLLAIRQPFAAKDLVGIDGELGTVLRMTASETTLMDADGNHLRLPNAMIFNGKVINYTRNPLRRFTVAVGVGTEVDLDAAQELGVKTLRRMKGVIDDPDPSASVMALGDSTVLLEIYGWVDQRTAGFVKVASEAHRLVKEAFDEAGIDMPPPAYGVKLERMPAALAKTSAPAVQERAKSAAGAAPEEIDVSPESDIDEQVADELARSEEPNLLEQPPRG